MKAIIQKLGDIQIVNVEGHLDFSSASRLQEVRNRFKGRKVVINFENLNFVGSSGITAFMEQLKRLGAKKNEGVKLCNLRTEFQRMFRLTGGGTSLHFYDSIDGAIESYDDFENDENRPLLSFDN